jgi:hypothetical protein
MNDEKEKFLGSWKLIHFALHKKGHETPFHPYGQPPEGILIVDKRHLCVVITNPDRPSFFNESSPKEEELSKAFTTFFSYAGPWDLSEGELIIEVLYSLIPNWKGKYHKRFYSFSNNQLSITTPKWNSDGEEMHIDLLWERWI